MNLQANVIQKAKENLREELEFIFEQVDRRAFRSVRPSRTSTMEDMAIRQLGFEIHHQDWADDQEEDHPEPDAHVVDEALLNPDPPEAVAAGE